MGNVGSHSAIVALGVAWRSESALVYPIEYSVEQMEAVYLLLSIVIAIIYFVPALVAFWRRHPNRWPILLVNLVFGATIVGWVGALIWSAHAVHRSKDGYVGGESGLNVFGRDEKAVRVRIEPQSQNFRAPATDPTDELIRLRKIYDSGVITDGEYRELKAYFIRHM